MRENHSNKIRVEVNETSLFSKPERATKGQYHKDISKGHIKYVI